MAVRPRDVEKYRRRTEGEINTRKGPLNSNVLRREARIQVADREPRSQHQEAHHTITPEWVEVFGGPETTVRVEG